MAGIGDAPCRSMIAEDVRDLQRRTGQQCRGLRGWLDRRDELLEWAGDLAQRLEGDTGVERRRIEFLVPQQHLDHADVGLLLEQMGGKAVPQRVWGDGLVDLGHHRRGVAGAVELAGCQRLHWIPPGKQPALGPRRLPFHQARRRSSRYGDSITYRSLRPLPCSTRMTIRVLSMSSILSEMISEARNPAP